jgi:hypothetical protein
MGWGAVLLLLLLPLLLSVADYPMPIAKKLHCCCCAAAASQCMLGWGAASLSEAA